jgi:hypothetical protein
MDALVERTRGQANPRGGLALAPDLLSARLARKMDVPAVVIEPIGSGTDGE